MSRIYLLIIIFTTIVFTEDLIVENLKNDNDLKERYSKFMGYNFIVEPIAIYKIDEEYLFITKGSMDKTYLCFQLLEDSNILFTIFKKPKRKERPGYWMVQCKKKDDCYEITVCVILNDPRSESSILLRNDNPFPWILNLQLKLFSLRKENNSLLISEQRSLRGLYIDKNIRGNLKYSKDKGFQGCEEILGRWIPEIKSFEKIENNDYEIPKLSFEDILLDFEYIFEEKYDFEIDEEKWGNLNVWR